MRKLIAIAALQLLLPLAVALSTVGLLQLLPSLSPLRPLSEGSEAALGWGAFFASGLLQLLFTVLHSLASFRHYPLLLVSFFNGSAQLLTLITFGLLPLLALGASTSLLVAAVAIFTGLLLAATLYFQVRSLQKKWRAAGAYRRPFIDSTLA